MIRCSGKCVCVLFIACVVSPASAQPILDGSISGDSYGAALSVQTVQTQFGDNLSELNAAYARVDGGNLYLALTGNLEGNFNKLNIFIDSIPGGENVVTAAADNGGSNPENDNWANNHASMTFDSGFEADFMLISRNGSFDGDRFDLDYAVVGGGLGAFEAASDIFGGTKEGTNDSALPNGIGVGFDNSNTAGIIGGTEAADEAAALAVETGFEYKIPLAVLGNPTGEIKIAAMVNNGDHNYLSNQFLGGLAAPQGNLGGDGAGGFIGNLSGIDLNSFAGDQFFTVVVPEPAGLTLIALAGLALAPLVRRRRRS